MSKKKSNFYVVWEGRSPGIYDNWDDCLSQVSHYPSAKFKGFEKEEEAKSAFIRGYEAYMSAGKTQTVSELVSECVGGIQQSRPDVEALAVDAACSGNPGKMEYQGVYVRTRRKIFHVGPLEMGTNNIGEFLAIVHGLAYMKQKDIKLPIYSDSANAISWVRQKKCKTKLEKTERNKVIFDMIARAEKWLNENTYTTIIFKWDTEAWGEIPADFGRK